jgi:hypothetical protein
MKCPMVSINRVTQECIEEKFNFWELDPGKCRWMSTK